MSRGLRIVLGVVLIAIAIFVPATAGYLGPAGFSLLIGAALEKTPASLRRLLEQSVMIRSAVAPQEIVYGRTKKSGVVTWYDTNGPRNAYLWFVITVVEHEVDGYETLWIGDVAVDIATEIDINGYVTRGEFVDADGNPLVQTGFHDGTQTVADSDLVASSVYWTTDHKGLGVAYFWVRCEIDQSAGGTDPESPAANVWAKGWPRDLAVTLRGAKVYDPRLDSTQIFGAPGGTHRVDTPSTWEWSNNPALCRADYLRHARFGPGYTSADVDWSVVATSADYCDELVDIPGASTQKRYTLNGIVSTADQPKAIVESMQSADHGTTLFLPAGIKVLVGKWDAPSHTIDGSWLAGSVTATSSLPADNAYNGIRGQYLCAADNYTLVEFVPRTAPAYETEDGVGRVWSDVALSFTDEEYLAQRLAIIELKKSRLQKTVRLECNFKAEQVELYQVVTLNVGGITGETFRVLNVAGSTEGTTILDVREETAAAWTYTVPDLATPPITPTIPRTIGGPAAPSNLAAATVVNGIQLTWDLPSMVAVSHIEVYASTINDRDGVQTQLLTRTRSESYFHQLPESSIRYYWIIARSELGLLSTWEPALSTGGVMGTAGGYSKSVFIGNVYLRKATTPAEPVTDDGAYNFGSLLLTPPSIVGGSADDWSATIPAGTDDLWVSTAAFEIEGNTGTDETCDWTPPVKLSSDGQPGDSVAVVNAFLRAATTPATPSGDTLDQYDFATHTLTPPSIAGGSADNWNTDVPDSDGNPVWVIAAIASVSGTTGIDSTLAWGTPHLLASDGADGADAVFWYIKPTNGTAISNGIDPLTLTVEAHRVQGATDEHLSTGTVQLYVGATLVTAANGYATGSNGFTGVFDSGDINGNVVVELKDGPAGTVLDTITLVDIIDGLAGDNAVYGYIEPSAPLSWVRASNQVTWTPAATTLDLDCTFVQAGLPVARRAWRITRNSSGILTGLSTAHKDTDLNTSRVTVVELDEGSQAMSVKFTYSFGGDVAVVTETAITSLAGADGLNGTNGTNGTDGFSGYLTNPSPVIPSESDGTGYTLPSGSSGVHKMYSGATDITSTSTHSIVGGTNNGATWTKTQNGLTLTVVTASGLYSVAGASWTTDQEQFTIRGSYAGGGGFIQDLLYTVTKSKNGADGGGGSTLVELTGRFIAASATEPTNPYAFVRVDSDGFMYHGSHSNTVGTSYATWKLSGAAADYDVKATVLSATAPSSGSATGAWLTCGADQSWYRNDIVAGDPTEYELTTLEIKVRLNATGAILDTCQVTLRANKNTSV